MASARRMFKEAAEKVEMDEVPVRLACSFRKNQLTAQILRYMNTEDSQKWTYDYLLPIMEAASNKVLTEALSEAGSIVYQQFDASTMHQALRIDDFKPFIKPDTYVVLAEPGGYSAKFTLTFTIKEQFTWVMDPPNATFWAHSGVWVLPMDGNWTPQVAGKGKTSETQTIRFEVDLYGQEWSPRILVFVFRSKSNQVVKIPIFLRVKCKRAPDEAGLGIFNEDISPVVGGLDSLPLCTTNGGFFHKSPYKTNFSTDNCMLLYYHPNLAMPIAVTFPGGFNDRFFLFESSLLRLPTWLAKPYPLASGKHLDLIELSKTKILAELAGALSHIHSQGRIHGDLCLNAVFLGHANAAKLTWNFEHVVYLPSQEKVVAKPALYRYLAPEIFWENLTKITPAAEVFSFGILMYEVLTGQPLDRVGEDICSGLLPPLRPGTFVAPQNISGKVSQLFYRATNPTFDDIVMRCVSPDPSARPSMEEVQAALEDSFKNMAGDSFSVVNNPLCTYCKTRSDVEWNQATQASGDHLLHLEHTPAAHVSATLPPNLVTFLVPNCSGFTNKVTDSFSKSLKIIYAPSALLDQTKFAALPEGLEQLWLGSAGLQTAPSPLQLVLPPGLTALSIGDLDVVQIAALLPDTLKTLHAGSVAWKSQKSSNSGMTRVCDVRKWPSSLTLLSLPELSKITRESLHALPVCMEMLMLPGIDTNTGLDLVKLPLPQLKLLDISHLPGLSSAEIASIPKTLTSLDASDVTIYTLDALPDTLTNLICIGPKATFAREILPNLKTWTWLGTAPFSIENHFLLPTSLTYLAVLGAPLSFRSTHDFANLPRGLQTLLLPMTSGMADSMVPLLPRSLTHLDVSINASWTDQAAYMLPRSLITLDVSYCTWSPEVVPWLPGDLQTLILSSNTSWNDSCVKFLPQRLRYLDLKSNNKLTHEVLHELPPSLVQLLVSRSGTLNSAFLAHIRTTKSIKN